MEGKNIVINASNSFVSLLTVAFIVLKLCGVITWSWLWILSPIWISLGLVLAIVVVFLIVWLIGALIALLR